MYVCICHNVTEAEILCASNNDINSIEELQELLNIGLSCGKCIDNTKELLEKILMRNLKSELHEKILMRNLKSELVRIAAQLACNQNMASSYEEDYEFKKCTAKSDIRMMLHQAEKAQNQCNDWAHELSKIIDKMP